MLVTHQTKQLLGYQYLKLLLMFSPLFILFAPMLLCAGLDHSAMIEVSDLQRNNICM